MKKMAITIICLLTLGILVTPRPTMCVTMSIVTVTAYHYCPGSKGITSSGQRVKRGILAVSLGFGEEPQYGLWGPGFSAWLGRL
jgi:hypothetical protein